MSDRGEPRDQRQRSKRWKQQVGLRLKAVRVAAGHKTAREFAGRLGVEENTYTSWERGERLIDPEALTTVKELTGATSDYIYYGDHAGLPVRLARELKFE